MPSVEAPSDGTERERSRFAVMPVIVALLLGLVMGAGGGFFAGMAVGGLGGGFFGGFFDGIDAEEEPADVANTIHLDRPGFDLAYPGNWRIDGESSYYLMIESPGWSYFEYTAYEPTMDPQEAVEQEIDYLNEWILSESEEQPFRKWGLHEGEGVELRGPPGSPLPSRARVFPIQTDAHTIVIVEFVYDEDREMVEPGFELIRSTFHIHDEWEQPEPPKP